MGFEQRVGIGDALRRLAFSLGRGVLVLLLAVQAGPVWGACPNCCVDHGGISNSCSASGRIFCNDGTVSPTCLCSTCGVASPPGGTPGQLSIVPAPLVFPSQTTGSAGAPGSVSLTNVGGQSVLVLGISSDSGEFVVANTCSSIAVGATCSFTVTFRPTSVGARSATITISSTGAGSPQLLSASGTGTGSVVGQPPPELPPPTPPTSPPSTPPTASETIDLIEYHHAEWDHYFITGIADEIAKLDNGSIPGWARTGLGFKAYPLTSQQGVPVCRFFSTWFAPRSSHFYTPYPVECEQVKANSDWYFEGDVFRIGVPELNGTCPANTSPVYRLYNNGQGAAPNHRYAVDPAVRTQMLLQGWLSEGYGPLGVIMCAPQ